MKAVVLVLALMIPATYGAADSTDDWAVYLCTDSSYSGEKAVKLVYGYIGGKKTPCMPEHELLTLYGVEQAGEDSAAQLDSLRILQAESGTPWDRLYARIESGEKDLRDLDLREADLSNLDLSKADLRNTNLSSTDLREANLEGANLRGADLRGAYFKGASLKGADLRNARLEGAYLHETDLTNTLGLSTRALAEVKTLYKSEMDSTLKANLEETRPGKFIDPGWQWDTNNWSSIDSSNEGESDIERVRKEVEKAGSQE